MEDIIESTLSDDEIARLAGAYEDSRVDGGEAEIVAKFQYAYALLKSTHSQDVSHGITIFEKLYYEGNVNNRRDYLYYIAIGHTKLRHYDFALDCVEQFLKFEPENRQAKQLRAYIKEKLTKDGLTGIAITAGAVLVIGALVGLGLSLAKK